MPLLQRQIQQLQTERTNALQRIRDIDEEIEILEYERDRRDLFLTAVPDFPPGQPQQQVLDLSQRPPDAKALQRESEDALIEFAKSTPARKPSQKKVSRSGMTYHAGPLHPQNDELHPNLRDVAFKSTMFKDISYNLARMFVREWKEREGMAWFSRSDLSAIGVPASVATKRLAELQKEGLIEWNGKQRGGSRFRFKKPDPAKPEPRMRQVPPERTKPAYTDAPRRGEPIRLENQGKKGTLMQSGGRGRTKAKARDRAYEAQQRAIEERMEAQKSKAQRDPKWKRNK